jgi:DNA-binding transcriptional LysR family regulator
LQREPAGSLKILAPKSLTTLALGDAIASFAAAYPHLHISLMLDDLSFRSYDFVERGFDVAVHTTPVRESSLVARKISNLRWLLCASPKYLGGPAPRPCPTCFATATAAPPLASSARSSSSSP